MEKTPSHSPTKPSGLRADKRRAILDAAARIFMRDGFGLAGIDDIVASSGVSKRTLYAHFPSKEALFGAIVEEYCDQLLTPLRAADVGRADPRATLLALGRTFLDVILSPDGVRLYRVVIAEAPRFPELGRVFYEAGHVPSAELLARYIDAKIAEGVFREVDSRRAAEGFFQFVGGYVHERQLLAIDDSVAPADFEQCLAVGTDIFVTGLMRPGAGNSPPASN